MYCTQADMVEFYGDDELIQLTDRINAGMIDSDVLAAAIGSATATLDSYLGRYQLPLTVTPPDFKRRCADVARFYLYKDAPSESIRAAFDDVMTYFNKVAEGKILLAGPDMASSVPAMDATIAMESSASVFARGSY